MGGSLPASSPDVYGRRRSPWRLVLSLLVVLAVGLAVGTGLGRLTAPGQRPSPAPSTQPVTASVPGAGAARVEAGIPVGYQHTRKGAAQAAGNYLAAFGGQLVLDQARVRAALDAVADPSARARLESGFQASLKLDEGLWGIQTAARQGQRVLLTLTPIAYRMTSYTPDEATVSVWLVGNVGVADRQRLAAFFGVSSATVAWLNGDWRLRTIDAGSHAGDVIPACLQTPTPTGGVPAQLDGFVPYGG
jgi:hypothetical protein